LRAEIERRRQQCSVAPAHVGAGEVRDLQRVHAAAWNRSAHPVPGCGRRGRAGFEDAAVAAEEDRMESRIHAHVAHVGMNSGCADVPGPVPFRQRPKLVHRGPGHLESIPPMAEPDRDRPRPDLGAPFPGDTDERPARVPLGRRQHRAPVGVELIEPQCAELVGGVGRVPMIFAEDEDPRKIG
jgi:hypothetical protein